MSVAEGVSGSQRAAAAPRAWPNRETVLGLVAAAIVAGCAGVLATAELGSGDYGQWLMAARPYLAEQIPAYRLDAAIPPVVPFVLGTIAGILPDRLVALHAFAVLLLASVGSAVYLAAASLFRSRLAGVSAVVAALLLTDVFLELFAFGGLLQAAAIMWMWLAVAAHAAALRSPERLRWWVLGVLAIGLGAMSHVGTASIAVPAGIVTAVLASVASPATMQEHRRRLTPLAIVLSGVAIFWLAVLLPGGTELARNPASLNYRGPDRLWDTLMAFPPTSAVATLGLVGLAFGMRREWQRRRIGPWALIAAWMSVTAVVVVSAVIGGAATDYPRFAAPILAPLVVAAGFVLALTLRFAAMTLRRSVHAGTSRGWATGMLALAVLLATPWAVARFENQIGGYGLRDSGTLAAMSQWIDDELPAEATILAPVREAKWIEGLTGRAALFSGSIRYSFRSEEWQRSFAAETLLRSSGSIVNANFFVKLSDGNPATTVPRTVTIGANHGGEFLDLVRSVPSATSVLGVTEGAEPIARLANLTPDRRDDGGAASDARVTLRWAAQRQGQPVTFRQTIALRPTASTLELTYGATTSLPSAGYVVTLAPAPGAAVTEVEGSGDEVVLTYASAGSAEPRLRFTASGDGTLVAAADGTLTLRSHGGQARLLVTDLTGSTSDQIPLRVLDPTQLLERYGVAAAVLPHDGVYESRLARLESLGFRVVAQFGPYSVLQLGATAPVSATP